MAGMRGCLLKVVACGAFVGMLSPASAATRLFILTGQSNMANLDPETSFAPEVRKAFPNDDIIIVKEAINGQPISKWFREWKGPDGTPGAHPKSNGIIYQKLMDKVAEAMKGKRTPDSVTFVWMQGEADAKEDGEVYKESLKGLIAQVRDDLKRKDVTVVIGRISDFEDKDVPRPHWNAIREIQVAVATAEPLAAWVDTDDLNGEANTLHYNKEGYKILGERFAKKAVELIGRNH